MYYVYIGYTDDTSSPSAADMNFSVLCSCESPEFTRVEAKKERRNRSQGSGDECAGVKWEKQHANGGKNDTEKYTETSKQIRYAGEKFKS